MTVESSYHSTNPEIQTLNEQSKKYAEQIMEGVDEVQKVIVGQEQVIKKFVIGGFSPLFNHLNIWIK